MITKATALLFYLAGLWLPAAFGFSSDGSSLERRADRWTVRTNSIVRFTVMFTNAGTAPLRGFYYADQVPSELAVTPLSVSVNGRSITNYFFVSGQSGDVYSGCVPYRWVLEQPPGFIQSNTVPSHGVVQIVYLIVSAVPGTFALQEFSWAGYNPIATNASFGYSEAMDGVSLSFLADSPTACLALSWASNTPTLQLTSIPGGSYVLQGSTNLSEWMPIVTNIAPFYFTDSNAASLDRRFYRAVWLP